jgi:arylsulfatase A
LDTTRREFLRGASGITVAGLLSPLVSHLALAQPAGRAVGGRPNVILILADDLGCFDLGCYGQKKIQTPSLDRMAQDGMRFTDAYSGSAVCAPSRSCLLTGQHTGHTAVRGNPESAVGLVRGSGDPPLPEDSVTVIKAARGAGYKTACIGKWGMGKTGGPGDPLKQGLDYHFGYIGHQEAHNYYPARLWRNNQQVPLKDKQWSHDVIAEDALRWVREQAASPFMLLFTPTLPHSKLDPPSLEPYADTGWADSDKAYAAMVTRLDKTVGQLLELLRELKIDQNTLVLFTSDNGTHTAGRKAQFLNSSGPLRGVKRDVYEGGVRVPLIAWWPGTVKPGTTTDLITANWDFFPTFTDVIGAPPPANSDGISILPTLTGRPKDQKQHEYLYWEFQEQAGKQAVRQGKYKGVRLNVAKQENPPIELYDLERDPGETKNIAADHPDIVRGIERIMTSARVPSPTFPLLQAELAAAKASAGK